ALQHLRDLEDGIALLRRGYLCSLVDFVERCRVGDRASEFWLDRYAGGEIGHSLGCILACIRRSTGRLGLALVCSARFGIAHGNEVVVPLFGHPPSTFTTGYRAARGLFKKYPLGKNDVLGLA